MTSVRAIAFDLDGTLAESKQALSPAMAEVLIKLARNMPVAVLSGGSWRQFIAQFLSGFPPGTDFSNIYLFPDSAAQCFSYEGGAWKALYDEQMSSEERAMIISSIKQALTQSNFPNPPQVWGEQIEDRGAEITFSALGQEAPPEEKKGWDPDRSKRMPLYQLLVQRLPEYTVALNSSTSIDITRKGMTKARGLRKFGELTSIPISDMIYVGDTLEEGGNDYVVIETGVRTHAVTGPEDTAAFIQQFISK